MSSRYKADNVPLNSVNSIMCLMYELVYVPLNIVVAIMFSRYKPVNVPLNMVDSIMASRYKPVNLTLFVCFVALHPKSTALVIAGRSVYLTTLFPGQA